jgi:hypothetical protein
VALKSRKPTGMPSWPLILLAGKEGAGKSWAAATASASPMVNRTFWIGIGEDDPDEYGIIPGANFEIVVHDGSYTDILQSVRDAVAEPAGDLPNMLVIDSMSRLWNQITDNAQAVANRRAKGRKNPNGDYTISPDLWNVAAGQWKDVMDAVRSHHGPVILTARLEQVMVMENGQPTNDKVWKVLGHKSLPFDVGVLIEMHERGHFLMTKAKSARLQVEKPVLAPGFTVEALWGRLGIDGEAQVAARQHSDAATEREDAPDTVQAAATPPPTPSRDWVQVAKDTTSVDVLTALWEQSAPERNLIVTDSGQTVDQVLRARKTELEAAAAKQSAAPSPVENTPESLRARAEAAAAARAAKNRAPESSEDEYPPREIDPATGEELI